MTGDVIEIADAPADADSLSLVIESAGVVALDPSELATEALRRHEVVGIVDIPAELITSMSDSDRDELDSALCDADVAGPTFSASEPVG